MWRLIILVYTTMIFTPSMEFPNDVDNTATVSASAMADIGLQWPLPIPNSFLGDVTLNESIAREYDEYLVEVKSAPVELLQGVNSTAHLVLNNVMEAKTKQQNSVAFYESCGTTKTCFGLPDNCVEQQNCAAVVSAAVVGGRYILELKSGANNVRYVSLAFSTDMIMGNDASMDCLVEENGTVQAFSSWITPRPGLAVTRQGVPQNIISLLDASYIDETIYCKLERDPVTTIQGKEFDLINNNFHFLIAIGTTATATSIGFHNIGRIASPQPLYFTEEPPNRDPIYEGCGTTKTCVGLPANCVEQQNCAAVVSAVGVGGRFIFELKSAANNVRYVSLAFSTDMIMGNDASMDCILQEDGSIGAYSSWITPRPGLGVTRQGVPQNIISLLDASHTDGSIYCKLERDPVTTVQGKEFDLINNEFHVLVAIGTTVTATSVGMHNLGRIASPQPLNFAEEPPNRDPIYEGCGTTKTCVGLPANCVEQRNCAAVISGIGVGGRFIFELKSGANNVRYVSLAFSTDIIMGNDASMDCILQEDGSIRAYSSWITPRPSLGATRQGVPQNIISLVDASHTDGSIYCKLERDPVTTVQGKEFDLINDKFHVLIAIGTTATATSVGMHNLGRIASTQPLNFVEEPPSRDPIYEGCGTTKICVGLPANCVEQQNCAAVISGVDEGGRFIFELKSGANNVRYVSLAFSTDMIMGNDASMDCILQEDGSISAYSSWITPRPSLGATRQGVPQNIISLLDASHTDGSIYCKLERDPVTTVQGKEFDLNNVKFHVLVAIGTTATATSVGMHNLGRIASTQPLNFTIEPETEDPTPYPIPEPTPEPTPVPTPEPTPDPIPSPIYEGCGITKTCFGMPNNCVEQQNCAAVVTVSFNVGRFLFELQSGANNVQYVALGFSTDEIMGNDANMECIKDQGSVRAFASWNTPRPGLGVTRQGVPQNILSLLESSYIGGKIYCKLERDPITIIQGKEFNLFSDKFHLLIAIGTTVTATAVGIHDLGRIASTQPLNFTEVGTLEGRSLILYRLHGAFMLAAWIGTASIGMLLARYFKQTWVGSSLCGKDQWFTWHRVFMIATWVLTVAAFVIIFVEVGGWSAEDNPHAVLGTIATILCFIQPFMAVFRPGPADKHRPIFNWAHWAVGNVAYVLAIITIFFAVELSVAQLPQWFYWILIPFVGFHALMHLIFSISAEYSKIRSTQNVNKFVSNVIQDVIKERNIDAPIAAELNNKRSSQNINLFVSNGNKEQNIDAPIAAEYNNIRSTQRFSTVVSNGIKERNKDAPYSTLRKGLLGIYIIIVLSFMIAMIVISVLVPI